MFHRFAKFLVLLAAVQILGGHWAALQTVAWAQMLVDYSKSESLVVAVTKTFDGAHPCSLCATVSEGRQQEKKQDFTTALVKLDAVLAPAVQLPARQSFAHHYFTVSCPSRERAQRPPTPPPRLA